MLGVAHAFIGGFALSLYGGSRATTDIDVLLEVTPDQVNGFLRPELTRINHKFAQIDMRFFFAPEQIGDLRGDELVAANQHNVLVEMLPVNQLGLPTRITSEMICMNQSMAPNFLSSEAMR